VGLDMAAWWKPTAEGYFKHVPKAAILEAVGEFAPDHVTRLAKLKKADIASEAERLADGTGWMPAIFKAEGPQDREGPSRTPRMPRQWRMNPPRRWPLDPHRRSAPASTGALRCGEPHDPHHHRPRMAATYAPARYAPAAGTAMATCAATVRLGLDGPRRPDRHSPITGRALPRAVWWIIETKE
jgi:hypothetical protein